MSMKYIRDAYGVPAKRGARIAFSFVSKEFPRRGTITSAKGGKLRVRWDGDMHTWPAPLHPTWKVEYLSPNAEAQLSAAQRAVNCSASLDDMRLEIF